MGDRSRKETQTSFAGGEYDPELWGRRDLAWYGVGLRRSFNGYPLPHGPWVNRPGTEHLYDMTSIAAATQYRAVVRPFVFSDDDSLVLLFTHEALRFFRDGERIDVTTSPPAWVYKAAYTEGDLVEYGGVFYEAQAAIPANENVNTPPADIADPMWGGNAVWAVVTVAAAETLATPYQWHQLEWIRTSQVGDVVTITCRGLEVPGGAGVSELELQRVATDTFRLVPVKYAVISPDFAGAAVQPAVVYADTDPARADGSNPDKPWRYLITTVFSDPHTGRKIESAPFEVTQSYESGPQTLRSLPPRLVATAAKPLHIQSWAPGGQMVNPSGFYPIWSWRIYKGQGDVVGFVQEIRHPGTDPLLGHYYYELSYVDRGDEPNFAFRPPQGRNPFYFPGDAGVTPARAARTEIPTASCFHERRRLFARTKQRSATLFLSATDSYSRFDSYLPVVATDAFEPELAADRYEEIRHLVPGEPLIVLASGGEWAVTGSGTDEAVSPLSFRARELTVHGCSWAPPVRVGSTVIFVQQKGNVVRGFGAGAGGLEDEDFSLRARHLFKARKVLELAYCEDPYGLIWARLDDGSLLSFTYSKKFEAWGWARSQLAETEQANFFGGVRSMCSVPEGDEDVLYMVVCHERAGQLPTMGLQRFTSRQVSSSAEGVFLDAALTARFDLSDPAVADDNLYVSTAPVPPASWDIGSTFDVVSGNQPWVLAQRRVLDIVFAAGGRLRTTGFVNNGRVTVEVLAELAPEVTAGLSVVGGLVGGDPGAEGADWWFAAPYIISGLDHLEGFTVAALADGALVTEGLDGQPLVVSGGEIVLPDPSGLGYGVVTVGLAYDAELQTLDSPADKTATKIVSKAWVEVAGSRGGSMGTDLETLQPWPTREVADGFGTPLVGKLYEAPLKGRWAKSGSVAIRAAVGLPLTVLSITREVEY